MSFPTDKQIREKDYPRWDGNDPFERACLRAVGLPEDFHPTEGEAYRIVEAAMESGDFTPSETQETPGEEDGD